MDALEDTCVDRSVFGPVTRAWANTVMVKDRRVVKLEPTRLRPSLFAELEA